MSQIDDVSVVRPTLRCLREDLLGDIGPSELRSTLRTAETAIAQDETYLLPTRLTDIHHPLLSKANELVRDESARHEPISVLTDIVAIKVKTGDRRGAMWRDSSGQWWLIAGGHRKNDTAGDFYRVIKRYSGDSSNLLPTTLECRYAAFEASYVKECEREREVHSRVLDGLMRAADDPGQRMSVNDVFGTDLSISITPDENGTSALEIGWELLTFDSQNRFPVDVLAMVPGYESVDAWDYIPPPQGAAAPHTWFTYVSEEWVESMATSAELDVLLTARGDWQPVNPSTNGSEHYSHYAKGTVVNYAYVTGIEFTALCGAQVVAHRDYELFPICPSCAENLALLRAGGPG